MHGSMVRCPDARVRCLPIYSRRYHVFASTTCPCPQRDWDPIEVGRLRIRFPWHEPLPPSELRPGQVRSRTVAQHLNNTAQYSTVQRSSNARVPQFVRFFFFFVDGGVFACFRNERAHRCGSIDALTALYLPCAILGTKSNACCVTTASPTAYRRTDLASNTRQ